MRRKYYEEITEQLQQLADYRQTDRPLLFSERNCPEKRIGEWQEEAQALAYIEALASTLRLEIGERIGKIKLYQEEQKSCPTQVT